MGKRFLFSLILVSLLFITISTVCAGEKPIYVKYKFHNSVNFTDTGEIKVDSSTFSNQFNTSQTDMQTLFEAIDDFIFRNGATDITNFGNNLSSADDTIQKALDTIDDLVTGVSSVNGKTGDAVLNTDDVSEGTTNKYYSESQFNTSLSGKTTDDVSEGTTNKYYTEARVSANTNVSANTTHISRTDNPHNVTATQVGAIPTTDKGAVNGVAELDASGKIPTSQLPASVVGALTYQGVYDCSGGSYPSSPNTGDYYVCSVPGTISATPYIVGDWLTYNGTSWDKIDNDQKVSSVNSATGAVVLDTDNINEGTTNKYYTETRVTNNTSVSSNTTHRGLTNNPHNVTSTQVSTVTSNFDNNLSSADDDIQKALDTIDNLNLTPPNAVQNITAGSYVSYGVLGIDVIKCNTSAGDITLNSFDKGIDGQIIRVIKTSPTNALYITNQASTNGENFKTTAKYFYDQKKYLHTGGTGAVFTIDLSTEGTSDGNKNRIVRVIRTSDGQDITDAIIVNLSITNQIGIDLGVDQDVKVYYTYKKGSGNKASITSGYGGFTFICSGGTEWIQVDF